MSEQISIKTSHLSINLATTAAKEELSSEKSSTLKEMYVNLMDQLLMDGYEKTQISTIGQKIIVEKKKNILKSNGWSDDELKQIKIGAWWFEVAKENNCIDPTHSHGVATEPERKIVPFVNNNMKDLCYEIINLCRILIEKSKEGKPFEDTYGEKVMNEFYKQRHTIINNCKNAIDNKTKVPKNTELLLLECLSSVLGSTNKCAEVFMEQNLMRLKEQGKFFTLKQATKFQKGGKQSQLDILKPIDRDSAIYLNCSGVQCTCGCWNVKDKPESNKLECYDCGKELPKGHISKCNHCNSPLYKDRLLHIAKTGKCENCNETVDLPESLIEYAKSS